MNILDNLSALKKIDPANVLNSIGQFPQQCFQVFEEMDKLSLPVLKNKIDNVVVCGMGGSAFAPEIVKTLFRQEIKVPYEIVRNYYLPNYVSSRTLVIGSSYSGTTAETLSCSYEALKRKLKLLILTSNGELAKLVKTKKAQGYIFKEKFNPCHQPRVGSGYMISGHLALLIKTGLIADISFSKLKSIIKQLSQNRNYQADIPLLKNKAKQMALKLKNKFVFLVSSEFLNGAIHGFANQLNETAKMNSIFHYIPELNHHRLEGLKYPKEFKKMAIFVFYPSLFYDQRNQARYKITKEVIEKNGYQTLEFKNQEKDKISQTLATFIFNSYVSFYLAILNKVDPSKIPWVDYFKAKLKKIN